MVQEVLSGRPRLSRGWSRVMMMKQSRKQLGKAFLTKGGQEPRREEGRWCVQEEARVAGAVCAGRVGEKE